jgi:hypothetical protein
MSGRAAFKQADVERIIRAAERTGAGVEIDIRTLSIRLIPGANRPNVDNAANPERNPPADDGVGYGKENWDDED